MYYKKLQILFVCLALFAIIILFSIYKNFTTEHFYALKDISDCPKFQRRQCDGRCRSVNYKYVAGCDNVCRIKGYEWVRGCNGCGPPREYRVQGCNGCVPPDQVLQYTTTTTQNGSIPITHWFCGKTEVSNPESKVERGGGSGIVKKTLGG